LFNAEGFAQQPSTNGIHRAPSSTRINGGFTPRPLKIATSRISRESHLLKAVLAGGEKRMALPECDWDARSHEDNQPAMPREEWLQGAVAVDPNHRTTIFFPPVKPRRECIGKARTARRCAVEQFYSFPVSAENLEVFERVMVVIDIEWALTRAGVLAPDNEGKFRRLGLRPSGATTNRTTGPWQKRPAE
jgi:hypothetical protein